MAETRDDSREYRLDRGGIKDIGAGTNQTEFLEKALFA